MFRLATPAAVLALLAAPRPAAADFLLTVSGRITDFGTYSYRFDGTTEVENDLPPLLDLDRLAGGSFTATFRLPLSPSPTAQFEDFLAVYDFDPAFRLSYTLYDAAGAVVRAGQSDPGASALVLNDGDLVEGNPDGTFTTVGRVDYLGLSAPLAPGSDLVLPTALYGPDSDTYGFAYLDLFHSTDDPNLLPDSLTGIGLPTDAATFLGFPGRFFGLSWVFEDGDLTTFEGPYQYSTAFASFEITAVRVAVVPAPPSVAVAGLGLLAFAARRRAGAGGRPAGQLSRLAPRRIPAILGWCPGAVRRGESP